MKTNYIVQKGKDSWQLISRLTNKAIGNSKTREKARATKKALCK